MPPPWVIKYPSGGSSVGVSIAYNFDDLAGALEKVSAFSSKILVGRIHQRPRSDLRGDEFRNQKALRFADCGNNSANQKRVFFSYDAKYGGETQELCPANF